MGDSRAIGLLDRFVTDSDWQIRYRVVQALGKLGGTETRTMLEALAKDEKEEVAKEAQAALN